MSPEARGAPAARRWASPLPCARSAWLATSHRAPHDTAFFRLVRRRALPRRAARQSTVNHGGEWLPRVIAIEKHRANCKHDAVFVRCFRSRHNLNSAIYSVPTNVLCQTCECFKCAEQQMQLNFQ